MAQTVRITRAEDMPKKPGRKVLDASRRREILVPTLETLRLAEEEDHQKASRPRKESASSKRRPHWMDDDEQS